MNADAPAGTAWPALPTAATPMATEPDPADPPPRPPRPSRRRRWRTRLLIAAAVCLGLAVLIAVALAQSAPPSPLEPTSPGKGGTRALVQVLEDHGVDVQVVRRLPDAEDALLSATGPTTLVVADPTNLPPGAVDWLLEDGVGVLDRLVLADPSQETLDLADIPVQALPGQAPLGGARCSSELTERGDTVSAWTTTRFVPDGNDPQTTPCFPIADVPDKPVDWSHGAGLVITHTVDEPDTEVVVVGFAQSWANSVVADDAHAGIALRTLGQTPHLIWYQPGLGDAANYAASDNSGWPSWIGPVTALIAIAFVLFALAVGRRLGAAVVEPLPVLVPAAEITTSRGRLYLRTNDRGRSARILQDATRRRLAARLGVPQGAPWDVLVAAVVGATGSAPNRVTDLLYSGPPPDDAALIDLAQQLTDLEEMVRA